MWLKEKRTTAIHVRKRIRINRVAIGEESATVSTETSIVVGSKPMAPMNSLSALGLINR